MTDRFLLAKQEWETVRQSREQQRSITEDQRYREEMREASSEYALRVAVLDAKMAGAR